MAASQYNTTIQDYTQSATYSSALLPHAPVGASDSAALGSIAENSSRRWNMLKTARRLLPDEKIARCQNHIVPGADYVDVRVKGQSAKYHNLERCDSPSCPHCANARAEQARHELSIALAEAKKRGWSVALVTVTLRHNRTDALTDLRDALTDAWNKTFSGRFYMDLKGEWGMVGKVVGDDLTIGVNGWHPHFHAFVFFEMALSDVQIQHFQGILRDKWLSSLEKCGFDASYEHGLDVRTAESDIAAYIAKYGREPREYSWGADSELARANQKMSSHDGLTPMELLAAASGEVDAIARVMLVLGGSNTIKAQAYATHLWQEYYWAMKGRQRLRWGHMKRLLDLESALAQFEQDNPQPEDESYSMLLLTREGWREVKRANVEVDLLLVASGRDPTRLSQWLWQHNIGGAIIPEIAYEMRCSNV